MSSFSVNYHNVTKVELDSTFVENSNSRSLRVTNSDGHVFDLTFYGDGAAAFDAFPRAEDFRRCFDTRETDNSDRYRDFLIQPSPVSYMAGTDWSFVHKDYDGAPDADDNRCGFGASFADCMRQIDEWHAEKDEADALSDSTATTTGGAMD